MRLRALSGGVPAPDDDDMDASSSTSSLSTPSSSVLDMSMVDDSKFLHGRVDPGLDENIGLVESVPGKERENAGLLHVSISTSGEERAAAAALYSMAESSKDSPASKSFFLALPSELIDHILTFLGPLDLVSLSSTCTYLSHHGQSDLAWQRHVQDNVPGVRITSPAPCSTFRELYIAHDPHWFLSKYKIWFCDYFLTGKIIIARYDPRRGCIEGYRLVAERSPPTFDPWEADDVVLIHSFNPRCHLHMDQPVLQLEALPLESLLASKGETKPEHRFCAETPMRINERNHNGVFSNFMLTRPVEERPNMQLWPPPTIPARHRVRNASQESFVGSGHKPQTRSQVSDHAFRIRRWMEMVAEHPTGIHLGEEVYTYATLEPKLYTPTEDKPYRGIWVGDYSGHGCEFLLMNQPDDDEPFDEKSVVQREDETVDEWKLRKKEERIFRGSLEAIKLTGDPNVPRGEYTFVADDLSATGYVRTATEERFKGARIVKSRGHIAARMFRNDKYIESQLIMISPDRLAQYWVGFGHISFYERVNIDAFLSPFDDPTTIHTC